MFPDYFQSKYIYSINHWSVSKDGDDPHNDLRINTNFDVDIHTETHFDALLDSEFNLENMEMHRSRSLPTILMESDAAEDSRSIIDKGNIKGFNTLGKHGYDSPLGKHFSSSLIMNIPGKN